MQTVETLREQLRRLGAAVRVVEDQAADAREARDVKIEEADVAGLGVRQIAADLAMSPARVQAIITARTAARQARQRRALGL
jgi:hypothetical protein